MNEDQARGALMIVAEPVEAYDVLDGALREARRRRASRWLVGPAVVAVVLVAALLGSGPLRQRPDAHVASPGSGPVLPDRVQAPHFWIPSVQESPPGRAVAIFSGERALPSGDLLYPYALHVVGARPGVQRMVKDGSFYPGVSTLLSPDGRTVASEAHTRKAIRLLDLGTGRSRFLDAPDPKVEGFEPVAWSPDGRRLLATQTRTVAGISRKDNDLGVLDLTTGRYQRLHHRTDPKHMFGYQAAFSPDGRSVVYDTHRLEQVDTPGSSETVVTPTDTQLHIVDLEGTARTIPKPPGALLAGAGAWTPDGRSVVVTHRDPCCRGERARRGLTVLDGATGAERATRGYPTVAGRDFRLVGWRGDTAVVVYTGEEFGPSPAVVLLTEGATKPRVVLHTPDGVEGLDVARRVVEQGSFVPWEEPAAWPVARVWTVIGTIVAFLGLGFGAVLILSVWAVRRRAARRHWSRT